MFKQNLKQFFTSKTNWVMLIGISSASYSFLDGGISQVQYMEAVVVAMGFMGIRDAI